MKKVFALMLLTLGLIGFVAAEDLPTWVTPQPLSRYILSSTSTPEDAYIDLSTISESNLTDYNLLTVEPLGRDLASGESLNNYYYFNTPIEAATVANDALKQVFYFADKGSLDFLEESSMTGVIVSALGGLYFTKGESATTLACPTAGTDIEDLPVSFGLSIYPYKDGQLLDAKKGTGAPAHLAIGKDVSNNTFLIVQYNYIVEDTCRWSYQIHVRNEGVSILVDTLHRRDKPLSFAVGLKRGNETLLLGNPNYSSNPSVITDKTQGWLINPAPSYWPAQPPTLTATTISIIPNTAAVESVTAEYTTCSAEISVSDAVKETLSGKAVIALLSRHKDVPINWPYKDDDYQVGDLIDYQFKVVYRGNPTLTGNVFSIDGIGLTPNQVYYLALVYGFETDKDQIDPMTEKPTGKKAWSWTPFVTSEQFSTLPIATPQGVTAGTPTANAIPLTINPADGNTSMMVVKSAWAQNIYPTGNLKEGDTYDNYKVEHGTSNELVNSGTVVAFLEPGTTAYNLPMTPGEASYVHIYSVVNAKTDAAAYATGMVMTPVYLPATQLPLSYTFSSKDFIEDQPTDAMPILPPGMSTSTVLPQDATQANIVRESAFSAQFQSNFARENAYLLSRYPYTYDAEGKTILDTRWIDVITPECPGSAKITAMFKVRWDKPDQTNSVTNHKPTVGDSVRIEYSLNGGAWQMAQLFTVNNMPNDAAGVYSLSAVFSCNETDVVKVRYSYRTTTASVMHAIISYEMMDTRDCATPTGLQAVNDGVTDRTIALKWVDNNVISTGNYLVSYQKADAEDWNTVTVDKTETVLNLESNTVYDIKVAAVCADETSLETAPVRISTAAGMPYIENMEFVFDEATYDYSNTPDVTVYNGELGTALQADDYMNSTTTWSIEYGKAYYIDEALDPDALGVATDMTYALLATPTIYVRKTGTPMPKTLTFRVNTYDKTVVNDNVVSNSGIDLVDPDLRLYILASTTGTFTWKDTVAAFDHNALKAETAAKEGKRGMELSVELAELGGLVQFAFYFHNPNPFDYTDANAFPKYLELLGISFNYDSDCFPVEKLEATDVDRTEASLIWEGEGEEYGITYYPTSDKAQAKTVRTEQTTLALEGLTSNTAYTAEVISYCTKGAEEGSPAATVEFTTLRGLFEVKANVMPEEAGTVTGADFYFEGDKVSLNATANEGYKFIAWVEDTDTLSKEAAYTFTMPGKNATYVALFVSNVGIEDLVKANFSVSTENGRIMVRNLNGIMVKDIDVYGLAGNRINRFTPNSREDLTLPVKVEHTLLFVRLNTETGAAVYKVYLH